MMDSVDNKESSNPEDVKPPRKRGEHEGVSTSKRRRQGFKRAKLTPEQTERVEHLRALALESIARENLMTIRNLIGIADWIVTDDPKIQTAAIVRERYGVRIYADINFLEEHVAQGVDMVGLIMHEVFHRILGHLDINLFGAGAEEYLEGIATDAFINATLYRMGRKPSARLLGFAPSKMFTDLYSMEVPHVVLRPPDVSGRGKSWEDEQMREQNPDIPGGIERWIGFRDRLYREGDINERDVYAFLDVSLPQNMRPKVILVGFHGCKGNGKGGEGDDGDDLSDLPLMSNQGLKEFCEELSDKLGGRGAGKGTALSEHLINVVQAQDDQVRRALLEASVRALGAKLLSEFADPTGDPDRTVVPPATLSRRDLVSIATGRIPPFFAIPVPEENKDKSFVYIDVSGSTWHAQPWMYSVISGLRKYVAPRVFLFSNDISEITLEDVAKGKVDTTGGTDFDCVVEHLLKDDDVTKAVLFTDGIASLSKENLKKLKASKKSIVGVMIDDDRWNSDNYYQGMKDFCSTVYKVKSRDMKDLYGNGEE